MFTPALRASSPIFMLSFSALYLSIESANQQGASFLVQTNVQVIVASAAEATHLDRNPSALSARQNDNRALICSSRRRSHRHRDRSELRFVDVHQLRAESWFCAWSGERKAGITHSR